MEGQALQMCQGRPSCSGGWLWLAMGSATLVWPTLSCVFVHIHVWYRNVRGYTTAQVNRYFIGRKDVVFLTLRKKAVVIHTFSSGGKGSKGPLDRAQETTAPPSCFFSPLLSAGETCKPSLQPILDKAPSSTSVSCRILISSLASAGNPSQSLHEALT